MPQRFAVFRDRVPDRLRLHVDPLNVRQEETALQMILTEPLSLVRPQGIRTPDPLIKSSLKLILAGLRTSYGKTKVAQCGRIPSGHCVTVWCTCQPSRLTAASRPAAPRIPWSDRIPFSESLRADYATGAIGRRRPQSSKGKLHMRLRFFVRPRSAGQSSPGPKPARQRRTSSRRS